MTIALEPSPSMATLRPFLSSLRLPSLGVPEAFYAHRAQQATVRRRIHIELGGLDALSPRKWLAAHAEDEINQLLALENGWDGRHADPVSSDAVQAAVEALFAIAPEQVLPPQFFPLPDGGLQLEWHALSSIELEVGPDGELHILMTDDNDEVTFNDEVTLPNANVSRDVRAHLTAMTKRVSGVS